MSEVPHVCGHRKTLLGRERVCVREPGHVPPHEDGDGATWIVGADIADTGYADLDSYLAEHEIPAEDRGAATAAWLHQRTGWDGAMEPVDPPPDDVADESGRG